MFPSVWLLNGTTMRKLNLKDGLKIAREAGLTGIELTAGRSPDATVYPAMTAEEAACLKERIHAAGLNVMALGAHRDFSSPGQCGEYARLLELADLLECRVITAAVPDGCEIERYREGLAKAAHRASELGITICIENHGKEHGTGRSVLPLLQAEKGLRLCYDTGNAWYYGGVDPVEDLPACAGWVGHVHLKDKQGAQNEWNFPALGTGYIDFPALAALNVWDNCPCASVEIEFTPISVSPEETERAVRASVQYLKSLSAGTTDQTIEGGIGL